MDHRLWVCSVECLGCERLGWKIEMIKKGFQHGYEKGLARQKKKKEKKEEKKHENI